MCGVCASFQSHLVVKQGGPDIRRLLHPGRLHEALTLEGYCTQREALTLGGCFTKGGHLKGVSGRKAISRRSSEEVGLCDESAGGQSRYSLTRGTWSS